MVWIYVAAGYIPLVLLSIVASIGLNRAANRLVDVARAIKDVAEHEPGTDSTLIGRVEEAERRIEELHDDVTRRYRKLAQERRRIEAATGQAVDYPDDDMDPEEREAAQLALEMAHPAPHLIPGDQDEPSARPRLRKRR